MRHDRPLNFSAEFKLSEVLRQWKIISQERKCGRCKPITVNKAVATCKHKKHLQKYCVDVLHLNVDPASGLPNTINVGVNLHITTSKTFAL